MKMNDVHIEGKHMNTIVTSKQEILKTSRELIQQQGWVGRQHSLGCIGLRGFGRLDLQLL